MHKKLGHHLQNLKVEFIRLDSLMQTNFTDQIALVLALVKKEINNILKRESEFPIHRTRQRYYFLGARPSHLLAMKIRSIDHFSDIPTIKSSDGNIRTDPGGINKSFQTFYSNLYESEVTLDKTYCDRLLNLLDYPKLSVADLGCFHT